MPQTRLPVRKLKELLRLNALGLSQRQIARSCCIGQATVSEYLKAAAATGLEWREVAGWDDDRLLAAVRTDLAQSMGIHAAPVFHKIVRWNRAIPQYLLGHVERVAAIQKRAAAWPGLFLAGNAYHGVALNDCTEQGATIADAVKRYLQYGASTS